METFSEEQIRQDPRPFYRAELMRYLAVMKDLMCMQNRTRAHFGYSPVNEAIMRIVNWLRADDRGDVEAASYDAWLDILDIADELYEQWDMLKRQQNPSYRPELDGLSADEFSIIIRHEWDAIHRDVLANEPVVEVVP